LKNRQSDLVFGREVHIHTQFVAIWSDGRIKRSSVLSGACWSFFFGKKTNDWGNELAAT